MSKKILLVDDDTDYTFLVAHRLEKAGFECATAPSAPAGIEKAKIFKPDLILLDLMMPQMSGYGFLREVKHISELEEIPVIVYSSLSDLDIIAGSLDLGAKDYITKCCDDDLIIKKINECLVRQKVSTQTQYSEV